MKIRRMSFPESSILYRGHEKYDYFDSYGGAFSDPENKISIVDLSSFYFDIGEEVSVLDLVADSGR